MRTVTTALSVALLVLVVLPTMAEEGQLDQVAFKALDRKPLKGIRAVSVTVEHLRPEAEAAGLSTNLLQTFAELRLRTHGVRVLSEGDLAEYPIQPFVYINVNAVECGYDGYWMYSLSLEVHEMVTLDRDPDISCSATVWNKGIIARAGQNDLSEHVRANLADMLDELINDILAARALKTSSSAKETAPDRDGPDDLSVSSDNRFAFALEEQRAKEGFPARKTLLMGASVIAFAFLCGYAFVVVRKRRRRRNTADLAQQRDGPDQGPLDGSGQ